jgi:hypothetical protein
MTIFSQDSLLTRKQIDSIKQSCWVEGYKACLKHYKPYDAKKQVLTIKMPDLNLLFGEMDLFLEKNKNKITIRTK